MPVTSLPDFLNARYDDREVAARAAAGDGARWHASEVEPAVYADGSPVAVGPWGCVMDESQAAHIAANDPAYVLADIASKRKILALLTALTDDRPLAELRREAEAWRGSADLNEEALASYAVTAGEALAAMAEPFAGHPDYQAAVRP